MCSDIEGGRPEKVVYRGFPGAREGSTGGSRSPKGVTRKSPISAQVCGKSCRRGRTYRRG